MIVTLWLNRGLSCSAVARAMHLSKSGVTKIIAGFVRNGHLRPGQQSGMRSRPPILQLYDLLYLKVRDPHSWRHPFNLKPSFR